MNRRAGQAVKLMLLALAAAWVFDAMHLAWRIVAVAAVPVAVVHVRAAARQRVGRRKHEA